MESTPDHKFVDNVSAVLAGLILITFVIIVLAVVIANRTSGVAKLDSASQAMLEERIRPIGDVVIADQDFTLYGRNAVDSMAVAAAQDPATDSAAPAAPEFESGQAVYEAACTVCHGLGVAGAPKMGDAAQWQPRVAQGLETLYQHAIQGYTGSGGFVMPAKGGRSDISDEHINLAVDYMVENSK